MKTSFRRSNRSASAHIDLIRGGDFPLNARLAGYALALLPIEKRENSKLMELIFTILSRDSIYRVFEQLSDVTGDLEAIRTLQEALSEATDADDIARAFYRFLGKPKMASENRAFSEKVCSLLESIICKDHNFYGKRVFELCSKMKLEKEDVSILELGCCYNLCSEFESVLDQYDITKKSGVISLLTGISHSRVRQIISKKGMLSQSDLLQVDANRITVEETVFSYLIGISGRVFAAGAYKSAASPNIPFAGFDLKPVQQEALVRMVSSPCPSNILLYGKPGTGKTELSKAVAARCGKKAVFVSYGEDGDERDRKTALIATVNSVPEDTVIIVDEVDGLLNTQRIFGEPRVNKGWINNFLDNNRHRIIWIANDISGVEESVRRRFAYSLQFRQLNWKQREVIWLVQLRKRRIKRFFQTMDVQQLARRFRTSPGLIAYAVKTVSQCRTPEMGALDIQALLEEILGRQLELSEGRVPQKKINDLTVSPQ